MEDEIGEEKFRELMMKLERIQGEFPMIRVRFINLEAKLDRLVDELTLPSGKVAQQFSSLDERITQLGQEPKPQA